MDPISVSPVLIGEEDLTGFKKFFVATSIASGHFSLKRQKLKSLLRPAFVIDSPSFSRAISLFSNGDALIGAAKIWFCKQAAVIKFTTSELMCIFSEERERCGNDRFMYSSDEPIGLGQFHNIP